MWNYLRNLQEKPLHTRKVAAYILTGVLFGLIILLWIILLNVQQAHQAKTSASENIFSPFESIKNAFNTMWSEAGKVNFPSGENPSLNNTKQEDPGAQSASQVENNYGTSTGAENFNTPNGTTTTEHATGTPL